MVLDIYEKCNSDSGCKDRWNRWKEHRDNINNILSDKVFRLGHVGKAAILGAGRCEDIDLKFLLEHVGYLDLIDYDCSSMERALERQDITEEEKDRITLKSMEFTGFYEERFLSELETKMSEGCEAEEIIGLIREQLKTVSEEKNLLSQSGKYDLVISGAVHSQLIIPYTEIALKHDGYAEALMSIASETTDTFAENYNGSLISMIKPGGFIFSYFDVMEISEKRGTLCLEDEIKRYIEGDKNEEIEKLMYQYGGVAGARYGFQHLYLLAKEEQECLDEWIWSFRDNKKYYVRSLCFSRK